MDLRRISGFLGAAVGVVALVGCGGGAAGMPETGGIEPATYMAHFSGRWTLDRQTSDDLSNIPRPPEEDAGPDVPPEGGVMRPGAGPRGRRGRPGRRGRLIGARSEMEAARATLKVMRTISERFTLQVTDSVVVAAGVAPRELRMPVAGEPVTTMLAEQEVRVSTGWEGGTLLIEYDVREGRTIVDRLEVVPMANRLLVTRTMDGFSGEMPDLRLAYDRIDRP